MGGGKDVTGQQTHLSLYRRWRPQRFSDVVDQSEIVRTLRNAVVSGAVSHAYLFSGERGIGKTTIARILARAVNCLQPDEGEPCNACDNCTTVIANRSLDIVEIDGASNRGIDHIRRLREEVNFSPADLKKKVYIIDEVHMLTNEAFNALLKTLEEPPAHALFAFATTEPHKVPSTIVSRCQAFEFRKIPPGMISSRLSAVAEAEGAKLTSEALDLIAHRADGGMRDALVMLEQAISYEQDEITADTVLDMLGLAGRETHEAFLAAIEAGDRLSALGTIDALVDRGKDLEIFLSDVIGVVRDRLASGGTEQDIAIARGLLEVKSELFRSLDRRIRLEIGVLDLMTRLPGVRSPVSATPSSEQASPKPQSEEETSPAPTVSTPKPPPVEKEEVPETAPRKTQEVAQEKAIQEPTSQEESTPASTARPATSMGDPDLDRKWDTMLDEIGTERIAIAAFLTECRPVASDGRITLLFHPSHTFHKESLEKAASLQYLAGAIHRHFGDEVNVELEFDPDVERKPTARELLREKAEMVRQAFEGEIVKEEL